jgi:hypothetical protein
MKRKRMGRASSETTSCAPDTDVHRKGDKTAGRQCVLVRFRRRRQLRKGFPSSRQEVPPPEVSSAPELRSKCFTLLLCPTLGRVLARRWHPCLGVPLLLLRSNQSLRQARLSDVIVTLAAGWDHQTVGKVASVRRILALAWCGVQATGALDSLPHSMWTPRIQHRLAAPRSVHPRSSSRRAWRHNRRSRRCHSRHPLTRRRLRC